MTQEQFGQLLAVGTALLWTCSALAWTSAGRYIGALAISFVRLGITCVFLTVHGWIARGLPLPTDATPRQWAYLGLSGFIGFFLSDLCLFKAFLLIGPRLSLMIYSLSPPFAALLSWAVLDDPLTPLQWLAMGVTLSGVMWVVVEQPAHDEPHAPKPRATGVALAVVGAGWQAIALLLTREGLGEYDAAAATYIRVIGGVAGYVVLVSLLGRWPAMAAAARHRRAATILTLGAIVGPYLGVMLNVEALRHCSAGVVATITSTMPVLILPFTILLYHEKVTPRAAVGAIVSVAGVAMLMLGARSP